MAIASVLGRRFSAPVRDRARASGAGTSDFSFKMICRTGGGRIALNGRDVSMEGAAPRTATDSPKESIVLVRGFCRAGSRRLVRNSASGRAFVGKPRMAANRAVP